MKSQDEGAIRATSTVASNDWVPDVGFLERVVAAVRETIKDVAPDAQVEGRIKSSKSTWNKRRRFEGQVRSIHDKVGVRVIVRELRQCFSVISRLHQEMTYLAQLYDDYITYPKANRYQSLHTTLVAENGWPFEVQVRTREMHERSEHGSAAHLVYKERLTSEVGAVPRTRSAINPIDRVPMLLSARGKSLDATRQPATACLEGKLAFVSTYPPVAGNLSSYTASLTHAIQAICPRSDCIVVAVSPTGGPHHYAEQIHYQIRENNIEDYCEAARFLNRSKVRVLSLQHEYGIFGGAHGAHILSLLRAARVPIVTTLHTVERNPTLVQHAILHEVCALSTGLIVSGAQQAKRLASQHHVSARKIATIDPRSPKLPQNSFERRPRTSSSPQWECVARSYLRSFSRAVHGFTSHHEHDLPGPEGATIP